jgi:hypothetical protein
VLDQERLGLDTISLSLVDLLLEGPLPGLYCAEKRGIGESLEHQQQQEKDDYRPEHQPELDREWASRGVLFLDQREDGKHEKFLLEVEGRESRVYMALDP